MTPIDLTGASREWLELDPEPRPPFHELRLKLHWASQVIAAFGEALVEAQPDASHTSMQWMNAERALVGMAGVGGLRLGLRLANPSFFLMNADGAILAELPLAGQTLEGCLLWAGDQARDALGEPLPRPLVLPEYAMPQHPVASGAPFTATEDLLSEQVARWFGNAASLLEEIRAQLPGAGEARCWPHHFDLATLWSMDPQESNPEKARSIGSGMLLGDDSVPEPYFYCNPWPRPDSDDLPALEGGAAWHTKGWVGALLRSGELGESATAQATQTAAYFRSAIEANRNILGSRGRG